MRRPAKSHAYISTPDVHAGGDVAIGRQPRASPSLPAAWPGADGGVQEHQQALERWPLLAEIDQALASGTPDPPEDDQQAGDGR